MPRPYTMNTANATSNDGTPTCQANIGKGVWFYYLAPASGPVMVSTCGSGFDTVLQVYQGDCEFRAAVACAEDNGPACAGVQASLIFNATAGTAYRILAAGYNSANGSLTILVTRNDTIPPTPWTRGTMQIRFPE